MFSINDVSTIVIGFATGVTAFYAGRKTIKQDARIDRVQSTVDKQTADLIETLRKQLAEAQERSDEMYELAKQASEERNEQAVLLAKLQVEGEHQTRTIETMRGEISQLKEANRLLIEKLEKQDALLQAFLCRVSPQLQGT